MSNDSAPKIQNTATQSEALYDPHTPLDPTLPNSPSSQTVTDEHGRIVGATHNEHGELQADSSNTPCWVDDVRPGDANATA